MGDEKLLINKPARPVAPAAHEAEASQPELQLPWQAKCYKERPKYSFASIWQLLLTGTWSTPAQRQHPRPSEQYKYKQFPLLSVLGGPRGFIVFRK
jgi:hypothetical protein